ncbi:uncharacterized protein LOC110895244 [Helianthus annuus]|uniref:uncharacterized protein LOC110895244 n=1 Tax=Helianthus annuus TaxID=4232 RepID=UPI000B908579|nr:uncharacterized protein LOC110895244 [Helianthus annuus]
MEDVRSQGALNAVYTQLCAQTAPLTQSRRPGSRANASQRENSTYENTELYARSTSKRESGSHQKEYHGEPHPHQRQSVHDRPCAVYNPEAEHSYDLIYRPAEAAENSKFVMEIALAQLEKAKLPSNVGKFNGLTDPDDHLRVFTSVGLVGGWTLPLWCHLFVQTLTGAARIWFDNLPIGQIESWKDLREKFLTHFSQQRRSIRDTSDVMNIWCHDDENLEDFITRYNKEVLEIGGVHEQPRPIQVRG